MTQMNRYTYQVANNRRPSTAIRRVLRAYSEKPGVCIFELHYQNSDRTITLTYNDNNKLATKYDR